MGKSPGKWIKTILFGKKSSKSSLSKGRGASKAANEKETWISAKAQPTDLVVSPPIVPQQTPAIVERNRENTISEKGIGSNLPGDEFAVLPNNQDSQTQEISPSAQLNELERARQYEAATKAQAAFRGYLARRAFRALRGIIRLQALVRGHLVRRQARATLRCLQGIVKLQALVRCQRVKFSDVQFEVQKKSNFRKPLDSRRTGSTGTANSSPKEKLRVNAFVVKFLGSSSKSMHLHLQYCAEDPNAAWVWLERWTSSRFWEPFLRPKKETDLKSRVKQGNIQNVATEPSRSRRVRRAPLGNVAHSSALSTSESEKPKRNVRKSMSHHIDSVQENPQSELEKVKRNLRKVSSLTVEPSDQISVETEKPKRNIRRQSISLSPDVPNHAMPESAENTKNVITVSATEQADFHSESEKLNNSIGEESISQAPNILEEGIEECAEKTEDTTKEVSTKSDFESSLEPLGADGPGVVLHEEQPPELPHLESNEQDDNVPATNPELLSVEDQTTNENQKTTNENPKTSKRRASFPAKQENLENRSQNIPTRPSYMAATQSAKAKLRGQGSPSLRVTQDGSEKNGLTRRHSLPSSTHAKLSSLSSPRTQRVVQSNGKGVTKNERSLLSSREGNDKVVQAEWRR